MNATEERADVGIARVDATGVWISQATDIALDVLFDDRRIWSFWAVRDSRAVDDEDAVRVARWPKTLRPYLDGYARISVREHVSEATAYDEQLQFGTADRPIAVIDHDGRPLATDKSGELNYVFATGDVRDREALLDTIEDVLAALREIDIEAFPGYGTLLGAVRNGRLIGHDSDADLTYVSAYTSPADLILESYRIDRHLRQHGYLVQRHSGFAMKIYVEEADGPQRGLDVFGAAYIDGRLYVMGEIAADLPRDRIFPLGTCQLEGRRLPAPADTDAWLQITYGPNWRIPDPAFRFATPTSTRRRLDGWFRRTRRFRDAWEGHWQRLRNPPREPTNFAQWVLEQRPESDVVIDIGSGHGADTLWYAEQGVHAIGLDYSQTAVSDATRRAGEQGSPAEFDTVNFCDMRSVLAVGAWLARVPGQRTITARLLVSALDRKRRENLWRLCDMATRDGTRVFLQLADPANKSQPYGKLIRPVPPDTIANEIHAAGGRILERLDLTPQDSGDRRRYTRMVVTWEQSVSA